MVRPDQLSVFLESEIVGHIHDVSPIAFEYSPAWLASANAFSIAMIPLQPGPQNAIAVQAFFENLLPEGDLRLYLAEQKKASTLFSLLLAVAGDTAGAFTILPAGQTPAPASYEPTSWEALAAKLGKKTAAAIDVQTNDARISLAGAQDKANIAIFADAIPRLPHGTAPSTHILKPDIKRLAKVWHSAANEAIVMRTAAHCGLPTAEVFYEPTTQACVVRRFDRFQHDDGQLGRLIQYDFCQLGGMVSERKYEVEGGPGIAACAALIRKYSTQSGVDLRNFIGWIFFNLYTGNNDSHAKNLSLYRIPGKGVMLTPFYDLMCTRLYGGLSQEFAFNIAGETRPGAVTRDHITAMAQQLGMQPRFVLQQAEDMAKRIPKALKRAMDEMDPLLAPGAKSLAHRLQNFIVSTTRKTAVRLAA